MTAVPGAWCLEPGEGNHPCVRLLAGEGGVLPRDEVDRSGIDLESFFQASAVPAEGGVLLLELLVLTELAAAHLRRAVLGLDPGLEEILQVEVLVGEMPAFDTGFDRELRDAEAPAGPPPEWPGRSDQLSRQIRRTMGKSPKR